MKGFEGIMSIGNVDLKGLIIEESPNSLIVTAKKKVYVPDRGIILRDQMRSASLSSSWKSAKIRGGLII